MTVEEAEKLFLLIDAMIDCKFVQQDWLFAPTHVKEAAEISVAWRKEEFLDLIVENQK